MQSMLSETRFGAQRSSNAYDASDIDRHAETSRSTPATYDVPSTENSHRASSVPNYFRMHHTTSSAQGQGYRNQGHSTQQVNSTIQDRDMVIVKPLGRDRPCCRAITWLSLTQAIAVAGDDGYVRVYGEKGNERVSILTPHGKVYGVCEGGKGVVITAGADGAIAAWNIQRQPRRMDIRCMQNGTAFSAISPVGMDHFAVGMVDGGVVFFTWKNLTFTILHHIRHAHNSRVYDIDHHGQVVATASKDITVCLWDRKNFVHLKKFTMMSSVFSVCVTNRFIAIGGKGYVQLLQKEGSQYELYNKINVRPCRAICTVRILGNGVLMAVGDTFLTFTDLTDGSKSDTRVQISAKCVQDADVLPNGSVAVCGTGRNSNSILRLSSFFESIAKQYEAPSSSTNRHTTNRNLEYGNANIDRRLAQYGELISSRRRNEHGTRGEREQQGAPAVPYASRTREQMRYDEYETDQHGEVREDDPFSEVEGTEVFDDNLFLHNNTAASNDNGYSSGSQTSDLQRQPGNHEEDYDSPVNIVTEEDAMSPNDVGDTTTIPGRSGTVSHLEFSAEMILEKMLVWKDYTITLENVAMLDSNELAELMASFMLNYDSSSADLFVPLVESVVRFFDYHVLKPKHFVAELPIDFDDICYSMLKGFKKDRRIGERLGLVKRAEFFFLKLRD